jgi:hypothetical protein
MRVAETAVPVATLGVEDPELGPSPRRPVAVPGDDRPGALADDVAAEPDPALSLELEPEPRGFGHGGRQATGETGWLDRDEEGLGATGERRQAPQPVGDLRLGRAVGRMGRKVDDEDVDRAPGEEHPGDRQPLVEGLRGQNDEPVEADASGGCLDGVEGTGQVEPGDDRPIGLGLGRKTERERRGPRAGCPLQRNARGPGQAARAHDRVEGRKAGPNDPLDAGPGLAGRR